MIDHNRWGVFGTCSCDKLQMQVSNRFHGMIVLSHNKPFFSWMSKLRMPDKRSTILSMVIFTQSLASFYVLPSRVTPFPVKITSIDLTCFIKVYLLIALNFSTSAKLLGRLCLNSYKPRVQIALWFHLLNFFHHTCS